jgi:Zonular occludens toxin (Zot)
MVIGRLGAGKTTWAALRCKHLASFTGRSLATTGQGWPAPWVCVSSFSDLFGLRDAVVMLDELHLLLPSSRGLLGKEEERELLVWLSLARKRGLDVVGTTQAYTRVATHYRQLLTTVWIAQPRVRGRLHSAVGYDPPEEGGQQSQPRQWYAPGAAKIPTNAVVWTPWALRSGGVGEGESSGVAADSTRPAVFASALGADDGVRMLPDAFTGDVGRGTDFMHRNSSYDTQR